MRVNVVLVTGFESNPIEETQGNLGVEIEGEKRADMGR